MFKNNKLTIHDIQVQVHLGVTSEERSQPQMISWQVQCLVDSSSIDKNRSYVCYNSLIRQLIQHSQSRSFHLVEEMTSYCFKKIKEDFPKIQSLKLSLKKIHPEIQGPVVFECGDF